MFEFSWATLSIIDIGVLSISIIGLWWLKNQVERYKALSEELERRYNALQQEHITLQQGHETLQQEHITLQQGYETLQQEHTTLQQGHEMLRQEHTTLQQEFPNFSKHGGSEIYSLLNQHNALQEAHSILLNQHNALQEAHDALLNQHNTLQEENATLRAGLDVIAREQKALQTSHDRLSGTIRRTRRKSDASL